MGNPLHALFARGSLVQIAGVAGAEEARMLAECGADILGFPLGEVRTSGDVDEDGAAAIVRELSPRAAGMLITYSSAAEEIARLYRKLGAHGAQLHGAIAVDEVQRLKSLSNGIFVVKTLAARDGALAALIEEMSLFEKSVDAFLIDTYDAETGKWGATGKTHDWSLSRSLVESAKRPVVLAGGLRPENVGGAIEMVRPWGVDVHTGVEDRQGRKDRALVERFIASARSAFGERPSPAPSKRRRGAHSSD